MIVWGVAVSTAALSATRGWAQEQSARRAFQERLDVANAATLPDAAPTFFDGVRASGGAVGPVAVSGSDSSARPVLTLSAASEEWDPLASPDAPIPTRGNSRPSGAGVGLANGAREGYLLGFGFVLYPAISLLAEGVGYSGAGRVLGALLLLPAMAVGVIFGLGGAVAGAISEVAAPGSTRSWDGIGALKN